jgi:hypothetical protein
VLDAAQCFLICTRSLFKRAYAVHITYINCASRQHEICLLGDSATVSSTMFAHRLWRLFIRTSVLDRQNRSKKDLNVLLQLMQHSAFTLYRNTSHVCSATWQIIMIDGNG